MDKRLNLKKVIENTLNYYLSEKSHLESKIKNKTEVIELMKNELNDVSKLVQEIEEDLNARQN